MEIGDRAGVGGAYANLGISYKSLGDFRTAIEYHEKDLNIAKEIGDRAGEGRALQNSVFLINRWDISKKPLSIIKNVWPFKQESLIEQEKEEPITILVLHTCRVSNLKTQQIILFPL